MAQGVGKISGTEFNPAISLILDGRYTEFDEKKLTAYELPGFMVGGEAGLPEKGFNSGHTELSLSANVDDKFYGKFTAAIVEEEGSTELELEEAYLETLGLGNGFTIKGGKFFSGLGYLNQVHAHAYDFVDVPLVYQAMLGGKLLDTGVQARWLAPTEMYLEFGVELTSGKTFPGGENTDGNEANTLFVKTGGDINESNSWQLGLSRYSTEFDGHRAAGAHSHGEEEGGDEESTALHGGEVDINVVDFVYKWAPDGNATERNFKFQMEYFSRDEKGTVEHMHGTDEEESSLDAEQKGFYASAVYQFMPKWRAGVRYGQLESKATGSDVEVLEETELVTTEEPEEVAFMVDFSHSEFSRFRLQVTDLELNKEENLSDKIYSIQYIMSLGAHGAHKF